MGSEILGHTYLSSDFAQGSLLMPGIKPGLDTCMKSTLIPILSLQFLLSDINTIISHEYS